MQEQAEKEFRRHPIALDLPVGNIPGVADEEAVGGSAAHVTDKKGGVYVWWNLSKQLKPGKYTAFIRARGKGAFYLDANDMDTNKLIAFHIGGRPGGGGVPVAGAG